ncbi:MAG: hypothetical protein HOP99_08535, partial [Dermatophilaceae bacterium]|nr:hypothetical protein [Dermatophilaceae bacterium]
MRLRRVLIALTTTLLITGGGAVTATALETTGNPHRATAQPLERAHAHNDYEHARP